VLHLTYIHVPQRQHLLNIVYETWFYEMMQKTVTAAISLVVCDSLCSWSCCWLMELCFKLDSLCMSCLFSSSVNMIAKIIFLLAWCVLIPYRTILQDMYLNMLLELVTVVLVILFKIRKSKDWKTEFELQIRILCALCVEGIYSILMLLLYQLCLRNQYDFHSWLILCETCR